MNKDDAEEYTQSLGQVVGGAWRQIALAKRLGVPKALGLSAEEWVNKRLGGYVKMTVEDRRKAVAELAAEGASTREIAEVIGVSAETARRDLTATNVALEPEKADESATNVALGPVDVVAALSVSHAHVAAVEKLEDKKAAKNAKREEREERKAIIESIGSSAPRVTDDHDLRCCSCRDLAASLEPNSIDWIVTDPPYPKEFLHVYKDLASLASKVLKKDGLLLVMVGQSYLPEIVAALSERLRYHWTIAYLTPGGQAVQVHPRKVNAFWKPVLVFSSGDYAGRWFADVAKSAVNDNDKDNHHWGQSVSGMADLLGRFVSSGETVLDPFLGAGTTGVAAAAFGCKFIGCDIDESSVNIAAGRMKGSLDVAA